MIKQDLSDVPALSCVENYFLAYFKTKFDIRVLYVDSYRSVNKVLEDFLQHNASYENYGMERVQDLSERLGITRHKTNEKFTFSGNNLNLIRVNEAFFKGQTAVPWRKDHYIAVDIHRNGYMFLNNYPLSEGILADRHFKEIYDNRTIKFEYKGDMSGGLYKELLYKQAELLAARNEKQIILKECDLLQLRNALLVLKILRRRNADWIDCLNASGKTFFPSGFSEKYGRISKEYEKLAAKTELQIVRGRVNLPVLQSALNEIIQSENDIKI